MDPRSITKPNELRLRLESAKEPEHALAVAAAARSFEQLIEEAGFGKDREKIRPYRELWIEARWMLGGMLAKLMRGSAGRPAKDENKERGVPNFSSELKRLGIEKPRAIEAQRLATFPLDELRTAMKKCEELPSLGQMIALARPYWYQEQRKQKHRDTHARAAAAAQKEVLGPFPLIYADPPWKWGHFGEQDQENEKGKSRTPDQHYPTMSYDEILAHGIDGAPICKIAHKDAALFLWCTSSNLASALEVMEAWGFEFKSSAAWVKVKDGKLQTGMGLVFRNAHELLLYGTRGKMPGPQHQPPSAFLLPRERHSAKPPEVRKAIERMYPDFDQKSRLELFARGAVKGWTAHGYEADNQRDQVFDALRQSMLVRQSVLANQV